MCKLCSKQRLSSCLQDCCYGFPLRNKVTSFCSLRSHHPSLHDLPAAPSLWAHSGARPRSAPLPDFLRGAGQPALFQPQGTDGVCTHRPGFLCLWVGRQAASKQALSPSVPTQPSEAGRVSPCIRVDSESWRANLFQDK